MESAVLIDTAIVSYALGPDSEWKSTCQRFLRRAEAGEFRAYASVEMVQELVHHRLGRTGDRQRSAQQGRDAAASCTLLNFDREVPDLSLELIERFPAVRCRDAVHAATAIAYGIERIASTDRAFDDIPGLTRVDPLNFT